MVFLQEGHKPFLQKHHSNGDYNYIFWLDLASCYSTRPASIILDKLEIPIIFAKAENPPSVAKLRLVEDFWGWLKGMVFQDGWEADSKQQCTTCTILGRHFERVSVPAHVRDKYKILMADREFPVVSGRTRRLFPRVRFQFWPQRRHHTCILFLSCELPRSRSRQNSSEPERQTSVSSILLEYDLKSR